MYIMHTCTCTVEPLYSRHHWDHSSEEVSLFVLACVSECPDYRGGLISECPE